MWFKKKDKGFNIRLFLLIAVPMLFVLITFFHGNRIQAFGKSTEPIVKVMDHLQAGQSYKKTLVLNCKKPGRLKAKIKAKKIGCNVRLSFYQLDSNKEFIPFDTPPKIFLPDSNNIISGEFTTPNLVLAGKYCLLIEDLSPSVQNGTIFVSFTELQSQLADGTKHTNHSDNTKAEANDLTICSKPKNYMLTDYEHQMDYSDYFKFRVTKKKKYIIRIYTHSNIRSVPYCGKVMSKKKGGYEKDFGIITGKVCRKSVLLSPGEYYLQIYTPDTNAIANNQIIYSVYITPDQKIHSIALKSHKVTLYDLKPYRTYNLQGKLYPQNPDQYSVAYKSSTPSVVSVSSTGKLTAHKKGFTTITCYAIDKPSVKATCKVTVKKPSLKVSVASRKIFIGNSTRCSLKRSPKKLKVTWKSSHPSVATVNARGNVTGKSVGKTKIYAISREGIKSNACTIIVHRKPKPKPKKPGDTTTEPGNKDDRTDKIAPVLSLSSAHLSPKGTITVTANVSGGTFSARGAISIKTKFGKSCVIRATAARGSGTILYQVNGKRASKSIVIY